MAVQRRELWWADFKLAGGSQPGFRPVLVVQSDAFNRSRLPTVTVILLTSNLRLIEAPGNVLIGRDCGLPNDAVANVSQVITVDRGSLFERIGVVPAGVMARVDAGLALVLDLAGGGGG